MGSEKSSKTLYILGPAIALFLPFACDKSCSTVSLRLVLRAEGGLRPNFSQMIVLLTWYQLCFFYSLTIFLCFFFCFFFSYSIWNTIGSSLGVLYLVCIYAFTSEGISE